MDGIDRPSNDVATRGPLIIIESQVEEIRDGSHAADTNGCTPFRESYESKLRSVYFAHATRWEKQLYLTIDFSPHPTLAFIYIL
ncbi:hypothetical protein Amn_30330 [Aminobacter sp. Y103A]|nr:hypothetical protein Amn_30330 [Aminobacter sp. SS-2016]